MQYKLQLKGREFTIDPTDGKQTCIYKALATLPEGEWVTINELLEALKPSLYSAQTIRIAVAGDTMEGVVKKATAASLGGKSLRAFMYRLEPDAVMPQDVLVGATKKQLYARKFI